MISELLVCPLPCQLDALIETDARRTFGPVLARIVTEAFASRRVAKAVLTNMHDFPAGMLDVGLRFTYGTGDESFVLWAYHFVWYANVLRVKTVFLPDATAFYLKQPNLEFDRIKLTELLANVPTEWYYERVVDGFDHVRNP